MVAAGLLALAIFAPNIVWRVRHDWPTLEFVRHIQQGNAPADRSRFIPLQLLGMTLAGTIVWAAGLVALLRDARWATQRWLAIGYLVPFVLLSALGGKGYYLGSWYLPVIAIGAVVLEQRWSRASGRWALIAGIGVTGAIIAPLFAPILPESTAVSLHLDTTNKDLGGMLGWPDGVDQVAAVFHSLPPEEQQTATILTGNYSEAGALTFWRQGLGLPTAVSGHNSYSLWGYGNASDSTVVVVGLPKGIVDEFWANVVRAGTLGSDGAVIDPRERGLAVWVCRQPKASWANIWPHLRHHN